MFFSPNENSFCLVIRLDTLIKNQCWPVKNIPWPNRNISCESCKNPYFISFCWFSPFNDIRLNCFRHHWKGHSETISTIPDSPTLPAYTRRKSRKTFFPYYVIWRHTTRHPNPHRKSYQTVQLSFSYLKREARKTGSKLVFFRPKNFSNIGAQSYIYILRWRHQQKNTRNGPFLVMTSSQKGPIFDDVITKNT